MSEYQNLYIYFDHMPSIDSIIIKKDTPLLSKEKALKIAKESDFKTKYFKDQNFYYKVIFNGNNVVTEYLMSLDTFEDMYSTRYNKYFILSTESFKEQDEFIKNNDGILESFSYFFNKAIKFIIGEIQGSIIYIMTTKTSYGIDLLKILYTMDDKTYNLLIRRNGYE